ncbi:MAG: hypothetical protein AABZ10_03365 [Nitrospirota bacterium]
MNALYPTGGVDWNNYVKNDGEDRYSASDTACDPGVDGPGYDACIHGGEMRVASGTLYIVTADSAGVYTIDALSVALIVTGWYHRATQWKVGGPIHRTYMGRQLP